MGLTDFFETKTSFIHSGILNDMTDIHCHILPAVDDGVSSYEESVKSLTWLKKNGVRRLFLTPHVMSDMTSNTTEFLSEKFANFCSKLKSDGVGDIPELKLGAEYMLDPQFENRKKEGLLTYADKHVLVETSYMMPPVGFYKILETMMEEGFSPVLAHPERYVYMQIKDYEYLKKQRILFQLNFFSFTGSYGRQAFDKAFMLLKKGFYDYAGSDFHHLERHEKSFYARSISKKIIPQIKTLFNNNNTLWD
jgi:tyrosine-protein phosphatase YwqE